jgi:lipoate-protein ligase A
MQHQSWRLIIDGDRPGAENMARDVAMLDSVIAGEVLPTLRLYGWSPACLSLGRHQGEDAADGEFCRRHGIDIVKRPTGGRAVLHHLELTYAVAVPLGRGPLPRPLQDAYRMVCSALVRGIRSLGVDAELTGGEVNVSLPGPQTAVPCFEAPAGGEVVVAGRKLVGSAMRNRGGCILQHGAILLDWDGRLQAGAMGLESDSSLRSHVTTLAEQLGVVPPREDIERALVKAFEEALEIELSIE